MEENARELAIKRLIDLNYNEKTAPHIVDSIIEVFSAFAPKDITGSVITNCGLTMNIEMKEAFFDKRKIHFTPKEFSIMEYFIRNAGKVIPVTKILIDLWGERHRTDPQYVRVNINNIRKKVSPHIIKNRPGEGYYMDLSASQKT